MIKITNISSVATWDTVSNELSFLNNKYIYIDNKKIWKITDKDYPFSQLIDAENSIITPGFIDCHTHPIFTDNRSKEFMQRSAGKTYQEITKSGGGINSSVNSLREKNEDDLYWECFNRIDQFLFNGTTTLEAKSGYGLTLKDEIKSLNVIKRINDNHILDLVPTFLGAHSIPSEYKNNKDEYINIVCNEMIPIISKNNLAEFCDVFCEKKYFNYDD